MKALWLSLAMLVTGVAHAAIDVYSFHSEEARLRYQKLTAELRCPKCQNNDIADSNAPIAADLRREVHRMVEEGKSDQEVIAYMTARYGDFVLYKPKVNETTWMLWYGPFVLLGIGAVVVLVLSRNRRRTAGNAGDGATEALDPNERERLQQLLQQDHKK